MSRVLGHNPTLAYRVQLQLCLAVGVVIVAITGAAYLQTVGNLRAEVLDRLQHGTQAFAVVQTQWAGDAAEKPPLEKLATQAARLATPGSHNLIMDQRGNWVVDPLAVRSPPPADEWSPNTLGEPFRRNVFEAASQSRAPTFSGLSADGLYYLGIARVQDPAWYLVTVVPKGLAEQRGMQTARTIVLAGGIGLAAALLLLLWIVRKQTAHTQHLQLAYFRAVLDQMPQAISVFDENLRLRYWNDGFINAQALGLEKDSVYVGVPLENLFRIVALRGEYGPGDVEEQVATRKALARRFEAHSFERVRPDGRTLLIQGRPIHIDGRLAGMISTYTDISERKAAEQKIAASARQLSLVFQTVPEALSIARESDGRVIEVNHAFELATGWSRQEIVGRTSNELGIWLRPDDRITYREALQGGSVQGYEADMGRKDGTAWRGSVSAAKIDMDGETVIIAAVRDVTELRRQEAVLRAAESRLAAMFSAIPDFMTVSSLADGRLLEVNHGFEAMTGLSREEAVGRRSVELGYVDAQERARFVAAFQDPSRKLINFAINIRHRDSTVRRVMMSAAVFSAEAQSNLVVVGRDVTEMEAMNEKFTRVFHGSPNWIVISRLSDGVIIDANEGFERLSGHKLKDVIGNPFGQLDIWVHPEQRAAIIETLRRDGRVIDAAAVVRRKDGELRDSSINAALISLGGETNGYAVWIARDVTESVRAATALRESEERWKLALESTGDGVWDWYVQTGEEFFSERLLQICGFHSGELLNRSDEFDHRTHPDDLAQVQQARLDHFEGRTPMYKSERRMRCKDGSWKWLMSRGMVIERDADGKPLRMIGTFTDINEARQHELALRASLAARRAIEASNQTLEQLGAIGREITATLETTAIFAAMDRHVRALLDTSALVIYRLGFDGKTLKLVYTDETRTSPPQAPQQLEALADLADRCVTERVELAVNVYTAATEPGATGGQARSLLCAPLLVGERMLGVMAIQSDLALAYGERERLIIKTMCAYGAIALANTDAQAQLIQSEKMASLGQLVASVAHEINTPIAAVKSSGKSIADALERLQKSAAQFGTLDQETRDLFARLVGHAGTRTVVLSTREERAIVRDVTRQLEEAGFAQARHKADQLVQLNAHAALADYLPLLRHPQSALILERAYSTATIINSTANINTAVDRVAKMVFALKSFSRIDPSAEMQDAHLSEGIETVLTIYQSQIKQGTELVRHYEAIPPLLCFPDELNQVWINLVHNALQAMNNKGTLTVRIDRTADSAVVSIGDTGCGIPEAIRARIFEPFFTTKPAGEGSGLGLDIVKKIVEKHQGHITLHSEVGVGTTFAVVLPFAYGASGTTAV